MRGHQELARRTGATIYMGQASTPNSTTTRSGTAMNWTLGLGVRLRFLETPGHTLEGITILAHTPATDAEPSLAFTGDTLFIGDVGRPDLAGATISAEDLARLMHKSLTEKILTLPDEVKVYPAHGAGSACGKALRDADVSTIGTEKATNLALAHIDDREQFVSGPRCRACPRPRPTSHGRAEEPVDRRDMGDILAAVPELTPHAVEEAQEDGAWCWIPGRRRRSARAISRRAAHRPRRAVRAVGRAPWCRWKRRLSSCPSPTAQRGADPPGARGIREGGRDIQRLHGGLARGGRARGNHGADLRDGIDVHGRWSGRPRILDVRTPAEWADGHIEGATTSRWTNCRSTWIDSIVTSPWP